MIAYIKLRKRKHAHAHAHSCTRFPLSLQLSLRNDQKWKSKKWKWKRIYLVHIFFLFFHFFLLSFFSCSLHSLAIGIYDSASHWSHTHSHSKARSTTTVQRIRFVYYSFGDVYRRLTSNLSGCYILLFCPLYFGNNTLLLLSISLHLFYSFLRLSIVAFCFDLVTTREIGTRKTSRFTHTTNSHFELNE